MRFKQVIVYLIIPLSAISQPLPSPATVRISGFQQRNVIQEQSMIKNLKFENIGPSIFSGRVTDIDANPSDPSHFYVAYASGGLWYTDNNGAAFSPLFDHEAVMTIGDIAVDWDHNIIWIGTGENNSSRSSYSGLGMYKSIDGGKSWEHRGLLESHHVGRILLHPSDPNIVWVAVLGSLYSPNTERGVYKTTDGGLTWRKTLYVNENAGAIDIVRSPDNPNTLFAATWERMRRAWNFTESGSGSGMYRSDDGGENWQSLTQGASGFPQGEGVGRIGLDVAKTVEGYRLYAIVDNYYRRSPEPEEEDVLTKTMLRTMSGSSFLLLSEDKVQAFLEDNGFPEKYTVDTIFQLIRDKKITPMTLVEYLEDANALLFDTDVIGAEVYVSEDGGRTWQKTHTGYIDQMYNTYGYYFGQIRVSPFDAKKVYILGVPILLSTDGGATWKSIDADNVHGDHHALWLSSVRDKHLILGNDGGINVSYDDGANYFKCNSPMVGQFYSVHTDRAKPYHVYGGLQDNGVWGGPHTYTPGPGWQNSGDYPYDFLYGGDGMQVQVDFRDNTTVYTGLQFGNYARINKSSGTNVYIKPRHELTERPYRWNWQTPILLSRHHQDILYMGSQFLHRSLNQGNDFEIISPDLTKGGKPGDVPYGTLTTIHESPLEFGVLYTGSDDGLIHVSKDFGRNWDRISDALPQDLWVSRVRASAHAKPRVYVSLNGYRWDDFSSYIYVSEDFGGTWSRLGMNLPAEPVNVIIEDPVNETILYVGTDHGLYISLDRGQSFMSAGESLPFVAVHDLDIQPYAKHLLVGTHGRSFYKADISQLQSLNPEILSSELYAFAIPASGMRYSAQWGMRRTDWSEYRIPEIFIPFYMSSAGTFRMEVFLGDQRIFQQDMTAEKGLNYSPYDLSVSKMYVQQYIREYTDIDAKAKIKAADNGMYYLRKGTYKIVLTSGSTTVHQMFELK
ncbi:MAG TPA: hypothetical protein VI603_04215 [Saprospiraceae bacterium]|nr:hypothetical protein [Saprospiraceae bacterium]